MGRGWPGTESPPPHLPVPALSFSAGTTARDLSVVAATRQAFLAEAPVGSACVSLRCQGKAAEGHRFFPPRTRPHWEVVAWPPLVPLLPLEAHTAKCLFLWEGWRREFSPRPTPAGSGLWRITSPLCASVSSYMKFRSVSSIPREPHGAGLAGIYL